MDWVKPFYKKQSELMNEYFRELGSYDRDKVSIVSKDGDVLDLAAGSGQTSLAMSEFSKQVLALELVEEFVGYGQKLMKDVSNCQIIQGDFYNYQTEKTFDAITYWDGFGVGSDHQQRLLLSNISNWLKRKGHAYIEVYTPWYADYSQGKQMSFGSSKREYGFDHNGCRWLDRWWREGEEDDAITQSLRCYSPADFRLLLKGTGLSLEQVIPCLNWENFEELYSGELKTAVTYVAVLKKEG